jgi:hypothetical protein
MLDDTQEYYRMSKGDQTRTSVNQNDEDNGQPAGPANRTMPRTDRPRPTSRRFANYAAAQVTE